MLASTRRTLLRRLLIASLSLALWPALARASAHPHGPDSEVYFSGTLKRVDLEARTIIVDAVDPRSMSRRDVLVYLDGNVTIRQGKQVLQLADLEAGHRLTCLGVRELDEDDRIVISDIRVNGKAK